MPIKPRLSSNPAFYLSYDKVNISIYGVANEQTNLSRSRYPWNHERLCKAISRFGLPSGAPRAWLRDPDFQARDQLGYMQPSGAMYWQCYLYAALQAAGIDQRLDLSTITILDKRWDFGERKWDFSPRKIKYRVQQSLKGLNYLVMIEFQVFRNVRCLQPLPRNKVELFRDQGRLIAPHVQGLIWGELPSPQQRALFEGGIYNAPGIKVVGVYDFLGALRYMGKPPYRGRSVFRLASSGRKISRPWTDMSLTLHHWRRPSGCGATTSQVRRTRLITARPSPPGS